MVLRSAEPLRRYITSIVMLLVPLAAGCARQSDSVEAAFNQAESAATKGDVPSYLRLLSDETIAYLRSRPHKDESDIDGAIAFIMQRVAGGRPHKVLAVEINGNTAILSASSHDPYSPQQAAEGKWKLVYEHGQWKLDHTEAFQKWVELAEWAEQVGENMAKATPKLDEHRQQELLREWEERQKNDSK